MSLESLRAWAIAHPENRITRQRKFRGTAAGIEKLAHDALMRRLWKRGLTLDQYHARAEAQDFVCAICGKPPAIYPRRGSVDGFHIDHNHETNKVRGLLCGRCNVAVGMLGDSIENALAVARYLTMTSR